MNIPAVLLLPTVTSGFLSKLYSTGSEATQNTNVTSKNDQRPHSNLVTQRQESLKK